MKELQTHEGIFEKGRTEINVKKRQKVEHVLEGKLVPENGHSIFEVNKVTGEVKKAEFKTNAAVFGAKKPPEQIIIRPDCVYIPALNKRNALKKYNKNPNQSAYYARESGFMDINDINFNY